MGSFRCYDSSNVIATLMMANFHLNTTDVAIFPNVCLWRCSLCSDLVLTLKNCIEPPPYARTAYVVAIWPSFHFDSFIKIWATCEMFLGKWFTAPPGKKFPVRLCLSVQWRRVLCLESNLTYMANWLALGKTLKTLHKSFWFFAVFCFIVVVVVVIDC